MLNLFVSYKVLYIKKCLCIAVLFKPRPHPHPAKTEPLIVYHLLPSGSKPERLLSFNASFKVLELAVFQIKSGQDAENKMFSEEKSTPNAVLTILVCQMFRIKERTREAF